MSGLAQPERSEPSKPNRQELALRLVSAIVLATASLLALYAGPWPFGALVAIVGGAACWEWGRIVRSVEIDPVTVLHVGLVAGAVLATVAGFAIWAAIALIVGAIVLGILGLRTGGFLTGAGLLFIGLPAICIAWLRSDVAAGLQATLLLLAATWATDSAAFAAGRLIGGPRLMPVVSPGKTWAGALGGLAGGVAVTVLAGIAMGGRDAGTLILIGLALALAAELGDLAESALKRHFGRKDSSALIPGHGGVLDRIDGLLAASLMAAMIGVLRSPMHPAEGLLTWI
jgi:phosphatidate cytidylyltransferase